MKPGLYLISSLFYQIPTAPPRPWEAPGDLSKCRCWYQVQESSPPAFINGVRGGSVHPSVTVAAFHLPRGDKHGTYSQSAGRLPCSPPCPWSSTPRTGRSRRPWLLRGCLSPGRLQPAGNGNLAPSSAPCRSSSTCREHAKRGENEYRELCSFVLPAVGLGLELDLWLGPGGEAHRV